MEKKFDPKKLSKLNNPERLKNFPPEWLITKTGITSKSHIVDYGAGTAFFSKALAQKLPGVSIMACDISPVMISWIHENIVPEYPAIRAELMQLSSLPVKDASAELVFMVNLHHELDNPEDDLKEAFRVLKIGGKIAISDWKKEESSSGPPLSIRVEPETIATQLINAGFSSVKVYTEFPQNNMILAEKVYKTPAKQ